MRIAYCCADPGVPAFGTKGCSTHVQSVLAALLRAGHAVTLVAARTGAPQPARLAGVHVDELPRRSGRSVAERELAARALDADLRDALDRHGAFDLVIQRHSLWSAAGMEHARAAGRPGVLEVNAPLLDEQARYRDLADRAGAEAAVARAFAAASAAVAVSGQVADYVRSHPQTRCPVHVVPNGVDLRLFSPARREAAGGFTVVFVGGLRPWHGLDTLVEGFALLRARRPGSRLLVIGDGPERPRLTERLAAAGLAGAATLVGAVAPDEVPALMAGAHAAVAPYDDLPGFWFSPLKLFEYMASGMPIVASRVGQVAEVIEDGGTGLLVRPGDPGAFADALVRLHDDRLLRAALGRRARRAAEARHGWDAAIARILELARCTRAEAAA